MSSVVDFATAYRELHALARRELGRHSGHTMTATGLVHEAYLKLAHGDSDASDRAHLMNLVVRAMRQILIDEARRRGADKRGGLKITLHPDFPEAEDDGRMLDIHDAIEKLKTRHPRVGQVVELHFWGGVEFGEIATLLGIDRRTVHRDWTLARAAIADALDSRAP